MFSVMFSAAASLGEKEAVDRFGRDKRVLVGNLQIGAEAALCKASFLRTTRTETVQALVIYLVCNLLPGVLQGRIPPSPQQEKREALHLTDLLL